MLWAISKVFPRDDKRSSGVNPATNCLIFRILLLAGKNPQQNEYRRNPKNTSAMKTTKTALNTSVSKLPSPCTCASRPENSGNRLSRLIIFILVTGTLQKLRKRECNKNYILPRGGNNFAHYNQPIYNMKTPAEFVEDFVIRLSWSVPLITLEELLTWM